MSGSDQNASRAQPLIAETPMHCVPTRYYGKVCYYSKEAGIGAVRCEELHTTHYPQFDSIPFIDSSGSFADHDLVSFTVRLPRADEPMAVDLEPLDS